MHAEFCARTASQERILIIYAGGVGGGGGGGYDDFEGGHDFTAGVFFLGKGPMENFPKSRTRYEWSWGRGHKKVSVM